MRDPLDTYQESETLYRCERDAYEPDSETEGDLQCDQS